MKIELSEQFWNVPDGAYQHEDTKVLHNELIGFLRDEFQSRPGLGTVEMMMVERTAFFYCWVRDRERSGVGTEGKTLSPEQVTSANGIGFVHERNYKEATQLLADMLSRLQRASQETADPVEVRAEAVEQVTKVIMAAIDTLPVEMQETVRDRFVMAFDKADF